MVLCSLVFAAACGGKAKSTTPSNSAAPTAPATAQAADECPEGKKFFEGQCHQTCETDADCPATAPKCLELSHKRSMNDDGTIGPSLESPLIACGTGE